MKYIKYYEKYEPAKYGEGEYISLGDGIIARIIKIGHFPDMNDQYYIEIFDKERYIFWNRHWICEYEIERYLNQEEKEIVKLALDINKFNI